jgi:hypothetical protein
MRPAGRERASLALVQARFARWQELGQLRLEDLDFSGDGVALPAGTAEWNAGVYHYVRWGEAGGGSRHSRVTCRRVPHQVGEADRLCMQSLGRRLRWATLRILAHGCLLGVIC